MNLGPLAFWLFLAAVVVAQIWARSRSETSRHETLRRIVEKTGQVDEAQMRALFQPGRPAGAESSPQSWQPKPGSGYRTLRVLGTLVLFVAGGLFIFFTIMGQTRAGRMETTLIGYASTSIVMMVGLGLLYCSRFLPRPPDLEPKEHKTH